MEEIWRDIPDYEGYYQVSDYGRVGSLERVIVRRNGSLLPIKASILRPTLNGSKNRQVLAVTLRKDGKGPTHKVHILVLEAFVGPRPEGLVACHFNDDPLDNRLSNLRWDTYSANSLDSVRNSTHFEAAKTHCVHGHEFTEENTLIVASRKGLSRRCLTCSRNQDRERKMAKRIADRADEGRGRYQRRTA